MKKLSYFFIALFASSMMLLACEGRQDNRHDQGRAPGDGIYQEDDRGMYRDDQNRQMQDQRQQDLYNQDTVGVQPGTGTQQQNTY